MATVNPVHVPSREAERPTAEQAGPLDHDEIAALRAIVEGTAQSIGDAFFRSLVTAPGVGHGRQLRLRRRVRPPDDAVADPRVLGQGGDPGQHRIRPGRDPLRGRDPLGALPPSPGRPREVPATIGTSSSWGSRATWASRCSTSMVWCWATWRSSTSGRSRPSPAGCRSSGSSRRGRPSNSSGSGSRSGSSRASGATGTSTRRRPTPMSPSAPIDGS